MTVEFVGSVLARHESELFPPIGPPVDPAFIARLAREYETARFASVWVGQSTTSVDAVVVAQAALSSTARLGVVVTLSPDVVEPTAAARAVATLAAMYPGRVQVRVPAGRSDDGRSVELGQLLRSLWRARSPLDHSGRYYDVHRHWSVIRPEPAPCIVAHAGTDPVFDAAIAEYADVCVIPAGTVAEVAARVARLRTFAGGRPLRFAVAVRPVVAEDARAVAHLAGRLKQVAPLWASFDDGSPRALATVTGACGAAEPFAGTVAAIAQRLADYVAAGVSQVQIRGFDPANDVALHSALADAVIARVAPNYSGSARVSVA